MIAPETRQALQDLMTEYVYRIDADALESWLDLFTDDCVYEVVPLENVKQNLPAALILCENKRMLRDRIVALREANEFNAHADRHVIGPLRIAADEDGWSIECSYAVYQSDPDGVGRLFSVGQYRDRVIAEGGAWRFRRKTVIVDNSAIPTLLATPI
jgi:anthranilate 1,2-dioxygenase small subunit